MTQQKHWLTGRKLIEFTCDHCGQLGIKAETEYLRNLKLGRKNYCCRRCVGLASNKGRKPESYQYLHSEANLQHLQSICGNQRDALTPFRYTLRVCKNRFKECTLTLEDLAEVWKRQSGLCVYTGLPLILPTSTNLKTIDITMRASLDRIDSSKGYTKDNIQFVSTPINYMKLTMSDKQAKQFLKAISSYTSTFEED